MEKYESILKTKFSRTGQQFQHKKNFPLLPDQIHKVPQDVRKALKVGKFRRGISNNSNGFPSRGNKQNLQNKQSASLSIKKQHNGVNFRQIAIVGYKAEDQENDLLTKKQKEDFLRFQSVTTKYFKNEVKPKKGYDVAIYDKRKLTPIKKRFAVEPKVIITREIRNFKSTFLNIEKVPLIKFSQKIVEEIAQKQQAQNNQRKSCSLVFTRLEKASFGQSQLDLSSSCNKTNLFRKSTYSKSPPKERKSKPKPFVIPFQKYYYRDFIWKCAYSFGVFHQSIQSYPKKLKVFVGKGNNSMLVKSLIKRRKDWWSLTQRIDDANFVWTQIKINSIFSNQKNQQSIYDKCQISEQSHVSNIVLINENSKMNGKILNKHEYLYWQQYFRKFRRTEQNLDQTMLKRNKIFMNQHNNLLNKKLITIDMKATKIHNHLPNNYIIGNKKALFYTMSSYYEKMNQNVFQFLPLTFHIQNGMQDPQYLKFLNSYYERAKQIRARQKGQQDLSTVAEQKQQLAEPDSPSSPSRVPVQNIWIVKPGEFTNRGNGITVCMNLQQIKTILKKKQKHDNGNYKTYIIQSYLEKPFLYQRRKFDIRHYMMIASINGIVKGYWYELGYIRTTSFEYSTKNGLSSVHLTNDAVQKYLPQYGKYEKGNKISYEQFQKYLTREYGGCYNFYSDVYPKMKKIATDSMRACSLMIDPEKKGHNFEIFGMDFMIDADFHPWLIQINNNPCLQISCPLLGQIIPPMVENAFKICLDSIAPPPTTIIERKSKFDGNILQQNKFELVYNSASEQEEIIRIFNGKRVLDLDYKQLQKEQDQVFDDDGLQLDD